MLTLYPNISQFMETNYFKLCIWAQLIPVALSTFYSKASICIESEASVFSLCSYSPKKQKRRLNKYVHFSIGVSAVEFVFCSQLANHGRLFNFILAYKNVKTSLHFLTQWTFESYIYPLYFCLMVNKRIQMLFLRQCINCLKRNQQPFKVLQQNSFYIDQERHLQRVID